MKYGICLLAQAPVRSKQSETSEMVTQMLHGETCKLIDLQNNWWYAYTDSDQYLGWINSKNITIIPKDVYEKINETIFQTLSSAFGIISINGQNRIISQGSSILETEIKDDNNNSICIKLLQGNFLKDKSPSNCANQIIGTPYLWGGRTMMGIDCSGLIFNIFKIHNILLPRDASQQVKIGKNIEFIEHALPNDICFFDNSEGRIVHTGILIGKNKIIHASGEVRIDHIDHQGIYNQNQKAYTHHLRTIKRITQ